jgi:hypothetical protein
MVRKYPAVRQSETGVTDGRYHLGDKAIELIQTPRSEAYELNMTAPSSRPRA